MRPLAALIVLGFVVMFLSPIVATASRTPSGTSVYGKTDAVFQQRTVISPDGYLPGMAGENAALENGVWYPPMRWRVPRSDLELREALGAAAPADHRSLLAAEASRWIGKGPRDLGVRHSLWCADAINAWLRRIGLKGTGSALAASFASWGKQAKPAPGVIAVKRRHGGNHVVVVKAVHGTKIVAISPNGGGNRVRVHVYRVRQFYAFREPV